MKRYIEAVRRILKEGEVSFDPRTKTYTIGISGHQSEYDMREGFPLLTTKNVPPRLPFEELFWKLRGERNVKSLVDNNIHFWTANAFDRYLKTNNLTLSFPKHSEQWNKAFEEYSKKIAEDSEFAKVMGDLGPVYGHQWRHWKKPVLISAHAGNREWEPESLEIRWVDQLEKLVNGIIKNPNSRYHVLSAWNPGELDEMAIGPCPFWHQFTVKGDQLDLHMVQRSCDTYLGVPFNIAQDSLLLHMIAKETELKPRNYIHTMINAHIYLGVEPRANFWKDQDNVTQFKSRINETEKRSDYLDIKNWYLNIAPEEERGNERKDHIPFVLEQMSKEFRSLPSITLEDIPFFEAIKLPVDQVVKVIGYNPHKWDAKAVMSA